MSVESLLQVVPAPAQANVPTPLQWSVVESSIGLRLPDDYKRYVETYGAGSIGAVVPFIPYCRIEGVDLTRSSEFTLQSFRQLMADEEDTSGHYPLWPDKGGIFPWGYTTQARTLFWLTDGHPDEWTVVVASEFPDVEFIHYDSDMTDFVAGIMSRRLLCPLITPPDKASDGRFKPFTC